MRYNEKWHCHMVLVTKAYTLWIRYLPEQVQGILFSLVFLFFYIVIIWFICKGTL